MAGSGTITLKTPSYLKNVLPEEREPNVVSNINGTVELIQDSHQTQGAQYFDHLKIVGAYHHHPGASLRVGIGDISSHLKVSAKARINGGSVLFQGGNPKAA